MSPFWRLLKMATDEIRRAREVGDTALAVMALVMFFLFAALAVGVAVMVVAGFVSLWTEAGPFVFGCVVAGMGVVAACAWVLWLLSEPASKRVRK